ncbi:uncharacterized protein LOC111329614 [Stylophora pistillata]|uniref:5'-methylthioadenosine/S-adenosylhomocysteine nucleosidase n=1 Tax=Stylophora pistillata TaxID=50429 RepID=A0A2B4SBL0_STYPI|nr:uncharacterized protein LOC111329614 [Stylophora pistillata]XP_022790086.1 uncharacterized protein LOC111329614 [Stylophora pistillata]XP_022790087.1 uncharacterized protein LOC111329614 [Stylophora pistillata]XP_022790088.1 uncharacterized protein LOC111329614 [Stylophora pistillata]XP_022790089.1 uncharacterized protein LOC111329614 [Stylophora pistillata]XP_022790090.1 uncharacterized protein LOC111329614 [Stylophora pistillata]PFX25968.1 5'-methylthioadenosine/S-adenosylhomocysteine nu
MANTIHTNEKGNPGARMGEPPKIEVEVPEKQDLPSTASPWEEIETEFLPVDFLLLTAKDCEYLSCLAFLHDIKRGYTKDLGPAYFGFNSQDEPKFKIAVIICLMGSSGPGGSIVVVQEAVPILRPRAVICVGYCGSLNEEKAKLGDVIVSSKLTTYAFAKEWEDGIEERGLVVPPNKDMANLIKNVGDGWKAPLTNADDLKVTLRTDGVFLSGPLVLNNPELLNKLNNRFRQGTAIEMEGEGLYTAAHRHGIEWLVIKGVSDFAGSCGGKSSTDSWRPFASVMAASVVFHMLNDTVVFEDWPHYENTSNRKRPSSNTNHATAKVTRVTR